MEFASAPYGQTSATRNPTPLLALSARPHSAMDLLAFPQDRQRPRSQHPLACTPSRWRGKRESKRDSSNAPTPPSSHTSPVRQPTFVFTIKSWRATGRHIPAARRALSVQGCCGPLIAASFSPLRRVHESTEQSTSTRGTPCNPRFWRKVLSRSFRQASPYCSHRQSFQGHHV